MHDIMSPFRHIMNLGIKPLYLTLLCIWATAPDCVARDRGSAFYRYEPRADAEGLGGSGALSTSRVEARTGYPVVRTETLRLIPNLEVAATRIDFSGFETDSLDIYNVSLPVTTVYTGRSPVTFLTIISPGLQTDFKSVTDEDISLFGMALFSRPLTDALSLSLGVVYNQDFGDPRFFPAFGFSWLVTEKFTVDMRMPRPRLVYRPSETFVADIHAMPSGDRWSIHSGGKDRELVLENIRTGLGLERRLTDHLWLALDAGVNLDRSYEVKNRGGRRITDLDVDNSAYLRLGIVYR